MYVKIHGVKDYVKGNTQSCIDLVDYLEKENEEKDFEEQERFFNHASKNFDSQYVIQKIDNNKKGLKDKDAKFFMLTINPSERELKHLAKIATDGREVSDVSQLSKGEYERYNNILRDYTREVMDEYAKNFNRGLSGNDLVYFAKIEQERHYKGTDNEVKEGLMESGQKKEGMQTHVHIIVSRKDVSQKVSLSPLANSRGSSKHQLNGKNVKVGFDRDNFVGKCEGLFDRLYNYRRDFENSYAYYKFSNSPLQGFEHASRISAQSINNPEMAAKNIVVMGIDKATNTKIASQLQSVSLLTQNPDSAKEMLVNKLDQLVSQLLPPEVKTAKKIAERTIKPLIDLGSGGLDI